MTEDRMAKLGCREYAESVGNGGNENSLNSASNASLFRRKRKD